MVRCHLRVSGSSGPCGEPGSCSPGAFSPWCSSAFLQPWHNFGCCSSPIPRKGRVKHKSPFCCCSRLPWLVLPASPGTLAGDGCVQKGTGVMSAGSLKDLGHPRDSSAPRTGVPTASNLLLVLLHCFFSQFLHCGCCTC